MNMYRKNRPAGWKRQKGMTLMELLVAGMISVIVSSGMVVLMASTLGSGTETIKMTKLSSEMRSAMQIMTRELRRANYHSTFANCFGDQLCLSNNGLDSKLIEININTAGDCFSFYYDRVQRCSSPPCSFTENENAQSLLSDSSAVIKASARVNQDTLTAFRLVTSADADGTVIGTLQMATDYVWDVPTVNSCPPVPEADWVDITNPTLVDIQAFDVDDSITNFASYTYTVNGTQSVERIGITVSGRLKENDMSLAAFMRDTNAPTLTVRDFVRVRNDIFRP